jgi:hypothetical protein
MIDTPTVAFLVERILPISILKESIDCENDETKQNEVRSTVKTVLIENMVV